MGLGISNRSTNGRHGFLLRKYGRKDKEHCYNFSDSVENISNFTFSQTISRFSSAKCLNFWWPYSSHWLQSLNFPSYFRCFSTFPPDFGNVILSPYFCKFPPDFVKCTCFLYTLCVFRFPPTLTMVHLCITQCTYWTPLQVRTGRPEPSPANTARLEQQSGLLSAAWGGASGTLVYSM